MGLFSSSNREAEAAAKVRAYEQKLLVNLDDFISSGRIAADLPSSLQDRLRRIKNQLSQAQEDAKRAMQSQQMQQESIAQPQIDMSQINIIADDISKLNKASSDATEIIGAINERSQQSLEQTQVVMQAVDDNESAAGEMIDSLEKSFQKFDTINDEVTRIDETARNISDIVDVIKKVADQTNLLALNAAIEAARAGEHGKGFAVVAEEVRNLSESTKSSVEDILKTIERLQNGVKALVGSISDTSQVIDAGRSIIKTMTNSSESMRSNLHTTIDNIQYISKSVADQHASLDNMTKYSKEIIDRLNSISK